MGHRTRPARLAVTVVVLALLAGASAAGVHAVAVKRGPSTPRQAATTTGTATQSPDSPRPNPSTPSPSAAVNPVDLERHLDRMRRLDIPRDGPGMPPIGGEATRQPDLYAAEFVRRLLTQDYRQPREELLAWVQAESTPVADQLVVGLVPPNLRDRFGVYSVSDASDGPAPIPTQTEWTALGATAAYTTVRIDKVIEPTAWSNAVQAGRVTDPGTTARLVAATITRHTGSNATTEEFSVALSLNLEGPPTRAGWRFVTAVTYTVIPVGGAS